MKTQQRFIGVVVPNYNRIDLLKRCINSLKIQNYQKYIIIVVDSSDKEDYHCILQSCLNDTKLVFLHVKEKGLPIQRNIGIKELMKREKIDYFTFVDSDDVVSKTFLHDINEMLDKNNNPDILSTKLFQTHDIGSFYSQGKTFNVINHYNSIDGLINMLLGKISASACGKAYNRKIFDEEIFDNKIIFNEDYEFNYRAFLKAKTICCANYSGYCYYRSESSMTRRAYLANKQLYSLLLSNIIMFNNKATTQNSKLLECCMQMVADNFLSIYPRFTFRSMQPIEKKYIKHIAKSKMMVSVIRGFHVYNKNSKIKKRIYLLNHHFYRIIFRLFLLLNKHKRYGVARE